MPVSTPSGTITETVAQCILTKARPDVLALIQRDNPTLVQQGYMAVFLHWWNMLRPNSVYDPAKSYGTDAMKFAQDVGCLPTPTPTPTPTPVPPPGQFGGGLEFVRKNPVVTAGLVGVFFLFLANRIAIK